ncbi:hypothetical protein HMPREF0987_00260 [Lachnospiraceae bacterium 9_1_43BFAA]|nr:hypothetical protein HMPREF0987_00260 [Lachnospiraceae bacterium 9_1_43BFAA]
MFSDTFKETIVIQKITKWYCNNCGTQGKDIEVELTIVDN